MALRISRKENEEIKRLNVRARRKSNRLYKTYGIKKMTFTTLKPTDFTSRQELNKYKQDINTYLKRTTHRYVKGGLVTKTGNLYYYPIPISDAWEIRRILRKRNQAVKKFRKKYDRTPYDIRGKTEKYETLGTKINSYSVTNKGLNFRYVAYNPIKFQPSEIHSKKTLDLFKYSIKTYQSKSGLQKKQKQAQENYIQALYNTFGNNARPLMNVLEQLSVDEFIGFFESDEFVEFYDVYDIAMATKVLQNLSQHFLNYINAQNIKIDDVDVFLLERTFNLSSTDILREYGQGALGGTRVLVPQEGRTTYYVDLDPEEYNEYLMGKKLTDIVDIEKRKHVLTTSPMKIDRNIAKKE